MNFLFPVSLQRNTWIKLNKTKQDDILRKI